MPVTAEGVLARPSLWWDFKWPLMKGHRQGCECSSHACSTELAERRLGQGKDQPDTVSCHLSAAVSWPHQTGTVGLGAPRFAHPSVWQLMLALAGVLVGIHMWPFYMASAGGAVWAFSQHGGLRAVKLLLWPPEQELSPARGRSL